MTPLVCTLGRKVRVYRMEPTTWEGSLEKWELQIRCFEKFFGEGAFGTRPFQSPSHFGIRLYFVHPHFPFPKVA